MEGKNYITLEDVRRFPKETNLKILLDNLSSICYNVIRKIKWEVLRWVKLS